MQFPLYKMCQYFPKPYEPFRGDINLKVDLSNYATKADIKNMSNGKVMIIHLIAGLIKRI